MKLFIQILIACVAFALIFAAPQDGAPVQPEAEGATAEQGQVVEHRTNGTNGTDVENRFLHFIL